MAWFITVGGGTYDAEKDDELPASWVDLGDVNPKTFLPLARGADVYWYEFYQSPVRHPDLAVALARQVALDHEQPFDVAQWNLETMNGLTLAVNEMWQYVAGDDLPKSGTTEGSQVTEDPTTETSSTSSSPEDGTPTEHAA